MKTMGIREFKAHMSAALRDVSAGETIEITNHGEVVALVLPPRRKLDQHEIQAALKTLDELAAEMGKYVTEPTDAAELISQMRR